MSLIFEISSNLHQKRNVQKKRTQEPRSSKALIFKNEISSNLHQNLQELKNLQGLQKNEIYIKFQNKINVLHPKSTMKLGLREIEGFDEGFEELEGFDKIGKNEIKVLMKALKNLKVFREKRRLEGKTK